MFRPDIIVSFDPRKLMKEAMMKPDFEVRLDGMKALVNTLGPVGLERFIPLNIGVGHDLCIRELAETVKDIVGYEGTLEFDATKPDGTPRKLMDVGRLNAMGWKASTSMQAGLAAAYRDFIAAI